MAGGGLNAVDFDAVVVRAGFAGICMHYAEICEQVRAENYKGFQFA